MQFEDYSKVWFYKPELKRKEIETGGSKRLENVLLIFLNFGNWYRNAKMTIIPAKIAQISGFFSKLQAFVKTILVTHWK